MTTYFSLPHLYGSEYTLAHLVSRQNRAACDPIEPITDSLDYNQPDAVVHACTKPFSILCGPPGTGKTTTLQKIVESFDAAGMKGVIACPTGKAAKRAREVVNASPILSSPIDCITTHRLLGYDHASGGFEHNHLNPFKHDYIIIDEFSMLETVITTAIFEAINPFRTRLVFCGDQHQLPSVGPGNIANDLIRLEQIPTTELHHIFRQGANSGIVQNASRIFRGETLIKRDPATGEPFEDFFFIRRDDEANILQTILHYVTERIPEKRGFDSSKDIQVFSPGKNSEIGVKSLNAKLRDLLNPPKKDENTNMRFRVGDKVINRRNNRSLNIVNGDVGHVVEAGVRGCVVDFGPLAGPNDDGITQLEGEPLDHLFHAYCYTVHSSQGSEMPCSLTPIHQCHTILLFRNLLYTAITRPRHLCFVVGNPIALKRCIRTSATERRRTGLLRAFRKLHP